MPGARWLAWVAPLVAGAVGAWGTTGLEARAALPVGASALLIGALAGATLRAGAAVPLAAWFAGAMLGAGARVTPGSTREVADAAWASGGILGIGIGAAIAATWRTPEPGLPPARVPVAARLLSGAGAVHAGTWGVICVAVAAGVPRDGVGRALLLAGMVCGGLGGAGLAALGPRDRAGAAAAALGAFAGAWGAMPDRERTTMQIVSTIQGNRVLQPLPVVLVSWPEVVLVVAIAVAVLADRVRAARAAREPG